MLKKLKFLLQLFDGIWSVPLLFFGFYLTGLILSNFFGYGTGSYDMAFFQPLLLAMAIVTGATNAARMGLWFTFRGIHRYLYGFRNEDDGKHFNPSKTDYKQIKPIYKLIIALGVYLFFIVAIIIVYLKLV